jgi:general secretion pathway protein A
MQRVTSEFNIDPLPPQEVKNYILHRLLQVESHTALFSDKAIHRIAEESRGIPRLINILCDTALVYAYARGARYVDSRIVKSLIADRNTQGISGPHDQSHEVTHT